MENNSAEEVVPDFLMQALKLVRQQKPQASWQKQQSFANAVAQILNGSIWCRTLSAASTRQIVAYEMFGDQRWAFKEITKLLLCEDGPIFGPLTNRHHEAWQSGQSFEDDPDDVAAFREAYVPDIVSVHI